MRMLREEHGFSKRKAAEMVDAVFECMARALRRGEEVEIPVGWIQAVSPGARSGKRSLQRFRNIQTGKVSFKSTHQPQRIIHFWPDPRLKRVGPELPPPDPAVESKQEELGCLLIPLIGREITSVIELQWLLRASVNPNESCGQAELSRYLDRLLARLRELVRNRRRSTYTVLELVDAVRQLYWIQS